MANNKSGCLNDSLSDFQTLPLQSKRIPLVEINVNNENKGAAKFSLKRKLAVSETKPQSISVGIQCVLEMKEKSTQNGSEKSISYAGKFEKNNLIKYQILLTEIIPNKNQTLEFCFKTGSLPDKRLCPTCGGNMSMINDSKVSDGHRWYCRIRTG